MQPYQKEFIELILARQVLRFGRFTLKSGRESPYFFNAGLINDGESLARLGACYAESIAASGIAFDMLFGPAYKGIPLATATALSFAARGRNLPVAFNRKEAKDHGEGGSLIGAPLAGRVLVIDDVITAGTAVRESLELIRQGREKAGKTMDGFDVVPTSPLVVGDDWQAAADQVRPYAALYVGGMGSREQNFYNNLACRMGYEAEAAEIQDRYLARDYAGAAANVPLGFLDQTSLLGPRERIAEKMQALAESGVTTLTVSPVLQDLEQSITALRVAVEALDLAGVG